MPLTNFGLLTDEQKTVWSKDLWRQARNMSFINQFIGDGPNAVIHRVTELRRSEKGARAVISLLADLQGDGVAGDRTLEGNEEAMRAYDQVIRLDQLRNANRHEGRMADQKSVIEFRRNSRDVLAYWLADRMDQLAFLTLSGVSYAKTNNGANRPATSDLQFLEFANDVAAPSTNRRLRWNGTTKQLEVGAATTDVTTADTPSWEMLVQLQAFAKERYIRGVKEPGGEEVYHVFMTPKAMAKLLMEQNFILNMRHALQRGENNKLFTGGSVRVRGMYIHEFRHVYNTSGTSQKWGSAGNVDGCQVLFCGAQALAMADIGDPEWVEKSFDFDNQQGISVSKIFGLLKPRFTSIYEANQTKEDFGVISCYVAQ